MKTVDIVKRTKVKKIDLDKADVVNVCQRFKVGLTRGECASWCTHVRCTCSANFVTVGQ